MSGTIVRMTRSVCPVCLKNIEAAMTREEDGRIYLEKSCPEHGSFRTLVWQGLVDPELWTVSSEPLAPGKGLACAAGSALRTAAAAAKIQTSMK